MSKQPSFDHPETDSRSKSHASERSTPEHSESEESSQPDFYLPGTPTPGALGRFEALLKRVFRRRGHIRADRRRERED